MNKSKFFFCVMIFLDVRDEIGCFSCSPTPHACHYIFSLNKTSAGIEDNETSKVQETVLLFTPNILGFMFYDIGNILPSTPIYWQSISGFLLYILTGPGNNWTDRTWKIKVQLYGLFQGSPY